MPNLNEDILQFIWQHKLFKPKPLITKSGNTIEIINPGDLNVDAGADFFNAKIKLKNITLAGNVEVHVNSSDWLKHKHQNDSSYDNIILHVVYNADRLIPQNTNNQVEVLELKDYIPEHVLNNYKKLIQSKQTLPCSTHLKDIDSLKVSAWLNRVAIERLESKVEGIEKSFANFNNDFTQTFYATLLKNFGFKVNSLPFELLATYLPFNIVLKHSDNQKQVEALLLGTAGLLDDFFNDKYIQSLQNEFEFLKNKYKLSVLKKGIFKYSRLRPANFPGLRLAQFAQLICEYPKLISHPQDFKSVKELTKCLTVELTGYWKNHYKPDGIKSKNDLKLGEASIQNILVNTFSYFFFFYGKKLNKPFYENFAIDILEFATFEKNTKTKKFNTINTIKRTALESQGMIHLHDHYCVKKRCLNCAIGALLLQKTY